MSFAEPWVLVALILLPILAWLLRVTPPAPRREDFPAIRLLLGLNATEETPSRTPWWLLALRILAAGLVIVALARPVLDAAVSMQGGGPVLLVIDNGWASAADWPNRAQAAASVLERAERAGRSVALLATAADGSGAPVAATVAMPAADLRPRVTALQPRPWPPDRAAATTALTAWKPNGGSVAYIADGLLHDDAFDRFAAALGAIGPVVEFCCAAEPQRVLLPPGGEADRLVARVAQPPRPVATEAVVLAQSGDGRTLGRTTVALPANAATGAAGLILPPELRNRLTRLVLQGPPSAASVVLLDERWRLRPVGLLAGDRTGDDAPFAGSLYYLRRALGPFTEVRGGDLEGLLARELSVLVLADRPVAPGAEQDALLAWVEKGGLLIRFAGPRSAREVGADPDPLLPVKLLAGDRQLGGALSWNEPARLSAFPTATPFDGLPIADEVRINRQVLAEPTADMAARTWAALSDGTPLVTQAPRGAGRVVLFHVTANADWSHLPLSGLFVDMLRRLVALSVGVVVAGDATLLAPAETLDGFGLLSAPPAAATPLPAEQIARTAASPRHPPGLYGPENGRRALNLGAVLPAPLPAPTVPNATIEPLFDSAPEQALGPPLLAAAVLLLALDMLVSLALRGLLRPRIAGLALLLAASLAPAHAQSPEVTANPALSTRLGYIVSGDPRIDGIALAGLRGLSDYVNRRTSAALSDPDAVDPDRADLSVYPLLYWPIADDAQPLPPARIAALNTYMSRGGIILIDTRDSGSGAGFAPGTEAALRRVSQGLAIPPLAPLGTDHVLSRSFYLLNDFPGRFTGEPVWGQRDQDRANDSVSPVIVGGNDWAAAWAIDASGRNPYAVLPGGQRQRVLAYRFGVNLVMYALTGNYKGDQVHVPAILQRLGQ